MKGRPAETLKNVSEKIEQGEGTLGKLIQDESLYTRGQGDPSIHERDCGEGGEGGGDAWEINQ